MTDEELRVLVAEVRGELDSYLLTEQQKLAKAHPGEEDSSEVPADESATAPADDSGGSDSGPPMDGADSGPPESSASGPPSDGLPPPDASAPPDAAGGGDPMADPNGMDPEAIKAELMQMPPEHVKALYLACKEVIFSQMGGGSPDAGGSPPPGPEMSAPPGPPGGGPPPGPPGPPTGPPDASPALKAEIKSNPANGGQMKEVSKSESDRDLLIADLQKKVREYDEVTSVLVSVVERVISVPPRKAVAGISEIKKGERKSSDLTKTEVKERLDRAARTNLKKSDRELINQFSVGAIGVEKVEHLLNVK